uniref:Uncharacterized protein n=1 Tax=Romanomermis culicivorax TaxID=13658 RepID=A0A915HXM3_ROMCU
MKIIGEEGYDATKIVKEEEEGTDATKIAGELREASEDQKAVSAQMTFVNELFIDYLNNPDYHSMSDRSHAETKRICELHVPGLDIPWFFHEQVVEAPTFYKAPKIFMKYNTNKNLETMFHKHSSQNARDRNISLRVCVGGHRSTHGVQMDGIRRCHASGMATLMMLTLA